MTSGDDYWRPVQIFSGRVHPLLVTSGGDNWRSAQTCSGTGRYPQE